MPVAVTAVIVTLLLVIPVVILRWMLGRLRVTNPMTILAIVLALGFTLGFAFETGSQITGAWGNLTASDSQGFIVDGGRLTAHGWETIARRAAIASLYSGLMAAAFWVTKSALGRETKP